MPRNGKLVRSMLALAVAAVAVALAAGVGSASTKHTAGTTIAGAGSSLVGPAVGVWSTIWDNKTGNTVTYASVGSGTGYTDISTRQVNFGASDAPLSSYPAGTCDKCIQMPWALGATVPVYNIAGIKNGQLHLTGAVLAKIYLGTITKWNDPAIKKINPKIKSKLPNESIAVFYRSDGSGDTYVFTDYLSKVSAAWKSGPGKGTSVTWPVGTGEPKNAGVAAAVQANAGAIGYVGTAYVVNDHLAAASMQNRSGHYVTVSIKTIAAAASLVKSVPASGELSITNPVKSKKIKNAWPLSTFTYVIVHSNGDLSADGTTATKAFITWVAKNGSRSIADLEFAPLPKVVVNFDVKTIGTVSYAP